MEQDFKLPINGKIQINGGGLNIELVLKEIGGIRADRNGLIEVSGSLLIQDGGSQVTKHDVIRLAQDLELKVSHLKAPKEYLRLSLKMPDYYSVKVY